ncbi:NADPH-dependent 1-acyldihydroxyacetone phosphate reductase [Trametes pubescens]|uniref:NADPH-dependent 1-acyldihydroxyacetone phosphate reductase n=1 Tax=Trametes pubescens TaxID=154538 RepID=A0A1M2VA30_TRAPU|nr:NADPH-dependent 1-acyldihydroxyacetone phosphate reductase [Trametes pubescens]
MASLTDASVERLRMDVTDETSIKAAVDEIVEREGRIDILVNNAGMTCSGELHSTLVRRSAHMNALFGDRAGPLVDVELERIKQTFDTNVFGTLRTAKAVIPHMAVRKSGTIVNIGSVVGEIPIPFAGIYSASKAAVHSITEALYMECLPLGISVVLVSAGAVRTNIVANMGTHFSVPPTTLYAEYANVIAYEFDPTRMANASATPPEDFARAVVGKSLAKAPVRVVVAGLGSSIMRILGWFPRGWVLRIFWSQLVEKQRTALAKSK